MDSLIESLALQPCRNTQIGSILARGISGGEVYFPPCDALRTLQCQRLQCSCNAAVG